MKIHHLGLKSLLALLLASAGVAQANDNIYWSVGVGAPGVTIGLGSAPPAVYPAPVYASPYPYPMVAAPRPIYYAPAPVYYPAPVLRPVRPAPFAYGYYRGYVTGHGHGHAYGHGGGRPRPF